MLKNLQVYNQYYRAQCTWHTSISMFYSVYWHCNFKRQVIANKQRQNVNFWCGIENCTYCQSTLCFQPAHPLYWLTPKETVTTACESVNWLHSPHRISIFTGFKTRFSHICSIETASYSQFFLKSCGSIFW